MPFVLLQCIQYTGILFTCHPALFCRHFHFSLCELEHLSISLANFHFSLFPQTYSSCQYTGQYMNYETLLPILYLYGWIIELTWIFFTALFTELLGLALFSLLRKNLLCTVNYDIIGQINISRILFSAETLSCLMSSLASGEVELQREPLCTADVPPLTIEGALKRKRLRM